MRRANLLACWSSRMGVIAGYPGGKINDFIEEPLESEKGNSTPISWRLMATMTCSTCVTPMRTRSRFGQSPSSVFSKTTHRFADMACRRKTLLTYISGSLL